MSEPIFWTLEATIEDGKRQELEQLLAGAVEETQANESTALVYEFFVGEDGKRFFALERYADSAAAMAHLGAIAPKLGPLFGCFDGPPTMNIYGTASDELRAATTDLQPTFFGSIGGFRR